MVGAIWFQVYSLTKGFWSVWVLDHPRKLGLCSSEASGKARWVVFMEIASPLI